MDFSARYPKTEKVLDSREKKVLFRCLEFDARIMLFSDTSRELKDTTKKSFQFVIHDGVIEGEGLFFT
jgi:hypothetical protein